MCACKHRFEIGFCCCCSLLLLFGFLFGWLELGEVATFCVTRKRECFFFRKSHSFALHVQIPTTIYQLTKNYRSHDGILRLAAGVLDLLSKLFPDSFDKLARDLGYFHGPKPVLLEFSNRHDLVSGLKGNQRETSEPIEFGADQVSNLLTLVNSMCLCWTFCCSVCVLYVDCDVHVYLFWVVKC